MNASSNSQSVINNLGNSMNETLSKVLIRHGTKGEPRSDARYLRELAEKTYKDVGHTEEGQRHCNRLRNIAAMIEAACDLAAPSGKALVADHSFTCCACGVSLALGGAVSCSEAVAAVAEAIPAERNYECRFCGRLHLPEDGCPATPQRSVPDRNSGDTK